MEASFVKNGENDIWVAFDVKSGQTLGAVKRQGSGFQVYVPSPVAPAGEIPQGPIWGTLEAAQQDLLSFY